MISTQTTFAKYVHQKYDNKCVITQQGYSLDAAHIVDKNICVNKNEYLKYNVANGISLKTDLHHIFDRKFWSFNPYNIEFNEDSFIIGAIWDHRQTIPNEIRSCKAIIYNVSYNLIYYRFIEFLLNIVERNK